jgi:hypothetical protein
MTEWTDESLADLQQELVQRSDLRFLSVALMQLHKLQPSLSIDLKIPETSGLQQLGDFAAGEGGLHADGLTNTHFAALTIVKHVIDFKSYALQTGATTYLPKLQAIQGFCIGFLSAAVVASSTNWVAFEHNTTCALRLAACIGAVIDAEDRQHGFESSATAISARWRTDSERTFLEATLDAFPTVSSPISIR